MKVKIFSILLFILSTQVQALTVDKSNIDLGTLNLEVPFAEKRLISLSVKNEELSEATGMNFSLVQAVDSDQDKLFKILRNTCSGSLQVGEECSILLKAQPVVEGDLENPSYMTPEGVINASFTLASSQGVIPISVSTEINNIVSSQKEYPIDVIRDENEDQKYRVYLKDESQGAVRILCPAKTGDSTAEAYCSSLDPLFNNKDCLNNSSQEAKKECGLVVNFSPKDSDKLYELKVKHEFIYRKAHDCQEILRYNPNSTSGKYIIYLNQEPISVYCDFETQGEGWTAFDDISIFQEGNNCHSGTPTINDGEINLLAEPTARDHHYQGACGISSNKDFTFSQIKITDLDVSNSSCGSVQYPDPIIEVVQDNAMPMDYSSMKDALRGDSLEGYNYISSADSSSIIFSRKLSEGLSNNTIYSLPSGKYKIHIGTKARSVLEEGRFIHSNGNVSNKHMYTIPQDIIPENSTAQYTMTTGWITHNAQMRLYNSSNSLLWIDGRARYNGSYSTTDRYQVDLSQAGAGSYFTLTASASVWRNSNGTHASDYVDYSWQYDSCMRKPVTMKLWFRNVE